VDAGLGCEQSWNQQVHAQGTDLHKQYNNAIYLHGGVP